MSRNLLVEVPDGGAYTTACRPGMIGNGIRNAFTVTGTAIRSVDADTKLAEATAGYQRYVTAHRLEKDLWQTGLQPDSAAVADQLVADMTDLQNRLKTLVLAPVQLANGAKELLDEVATRKITGEEDRYSHTDLWDFKGNLDGSRTAVAALRPVIDERTRPWARRWTSGSPPSTCCWIGTARAMATRAT